MIHLEYCKKCMPWNFEMNTWKLVKTRIWILYLPKTHSTLYVTQKPMSSMGISLQMDSPFRSWWQESKRFSSITRAKTIFPSGMDAVTAVEFLPALRSILTSLASYYLFFTMSPLFLNVSYLVPLWDRFCKFWLFIELGMLCNMVK